MLSVLVKAALLVGAAFMVLASIVFILFCIAGITVLISDIFKRR